MSGERSIWGEDPSPDMPSVSITVRLDPDLLAATQAEADRLGMTRSEYVRQALVARMAWGLALQAVAAGGDPENLLRFQGVDAKAVAEIAKRVGENIPPE